MEHNILVNVYDKLCSQNGGDQWSSILNCQTVTKESIRYFGGKYPDGIIIMNDCVPQTVHLHLKTRLLTSIINEKNDDPSRTFFCLSW